MPRHISRKQRLSSDAFSCSMAAMCLQNAKTHEPVLAVKLTVKDLRVLLVRRKENALHPKAALLSSSRRTLLSSRLSSVSFVPSPFVIAVHSDSSIEANKLTVRLLSPPVFFPKAEKIGYKQSDSSSPLASSFCRPTSRCRNVEFDGIVAARTSKSI
jgi:hypothetical protein